MSLARAVTRRLAAARLARMPLEAVTQKLAERPGAVILCYHAIGSDLPGYPFRTAPDALTAQIAFLKDHYEILDLDTLLARLGSGIDSPVAALTFDDGFADNLTTATPILEKADAPATLFAPRDLIRAGGTTHMDEAGLREIARHPLWSVGAHGVTHNVLPGFLPEDQRREMEDCRDWLADLLGTPPRHFAYPQGAIDATSVTFAARLFEAAFTTDRRLSAGFDRAQIRRVCPTRAHDDTATFARALLAAPVETGRT